MLAKGINYDTGFLPGGTSSREDFDPETVRREMQIIAQDLHCNAVRISGGLPERLSVAGRYAAEAGLAVWFSPFPCELGREELLPLFADCAERAEELRSGGAEVVLVTGCEMTMFASGFLPGETYRQRMELLRSSMTRPWLWLKIARMSGQLNGFLAETAAVVRERFGGRVTYASAPWERVDWKLFDIVSIDTYRDRRNASRYGKGLRSHLRHGKPVVATEFGTCAYKGAGDRGGMAWAISDRSVEPHRLTGDYQRDESEQVTYLRELLSSFEKEGLDGAFWFTFAGYGHPHRPEPLYDLDMASYGVVKVLEDRKGTAYPDMNWEPKQVFHALATTYRT
ncbi:hypothetical protein GCM10022226_47650 [Sphaerisporangium flaviroseum]|uniref:Abortive infection protein n=1 Tax=Sphaerisporangium flaviroseum TaxID=509199 RepID=A0ABP7IM80_9ACTN